MLEDLNRSAGTRFVSSYDLALAYLGLRDQRKTLDRLNASVQERSPRAAFLSVDPRFDGLRNDLRFHEALLAIGLEM